MSTESNGRGNTTPDPTANDTGGFSISTPFILRPVATTLMSVAVLLAGMLGYFGLAVSSLPQVDFPTIQVTTQLPGANPETMSNLVTAPLERQFGQTPSLQSMTSSSSYGLSQITLQFALDRDIDGAAQDVQAAINAASSTLPRNLPYPPVYSKVNPADTPILTLALMSSTVPLRGLSDLADTLISQRIAGVSGVGRVSIEGGVKPAVRIQADLDRIAAYGLGLADMRVAIAAANVAGPKGQLDGASQSYTIATNDQFKTAESYRDIVVAFRNGSPVLLKDVAEISEGLENAKVGGWYKGRPAVIINVKRQPGANVVETVSRIQAELPRLTASMPGGVELMTVQDRTQMIRASIHEVEFTLVLCVVLVVLVVLAFLRSVRATIIAGVALPMSLVATFGVMWLAGFSLDNLSLMALTIGSGFVIDDAIVMIENIVRHLEKGEDPKQAALRGAREIGFTVVSLTLSLIAVFIPMLFMTGIVGRMFQEFALTLTIAVVVSAVVSLTLTPMMCALLLKRSTTPSARSDDHDVPTMGLLGAYGRSVAFVLRRPVSTILVTVGTLALTVYLYVVAPKGFLPQQDTGLVTGLVEAAQDVSFEEVTRLSKLVSDRLSTDEAVDGVVVVTGVSEVNATPNAAQLKIALKPQSTGRARIDIVIERLTRAAAEIPGVTVALLPVQDVQISSRVARGQYQYTLVGTDAAEVTLWSKRLADRMQSIPGIAEATLEARDGGLRAQIEVDRVTAGRLGVSMQTINDVLNDAFGQRQISTIYAQSNQYRVVLEALPKFQRDPAILDRLFVSTALGQQVPLSAVARFQQVPAPLTVQRDQQFPAGTISFNLAPGGSLSDAVAAIDAASKDIGVPRSVTGRYSGDALEFTKALASQPALILAAIIAIYILLGVLYESFIHPFTILTSLPSAGIGALLALQLWGLDLSIVALIGIILLMGIVKKNAIMMIDFAIDAQRERGLHPREAILEAAVLRFRPIMMTTLAALISAIPLAVGHGVGAELRVPLGVSIAGGLLLSQLITLYTTPVVYVELERLKSWITGVPMQQPARAVFTQQIVAASEPTANNSEIARAPAKRELPRAAE
ncbi:MAG: efflux RND transporter permease subunit [Hyphomicrobiaceae bacterium]|nr:efflux RND transporter permease subunit [Hyphomicrobiaceae bacterium]